MKKQMVFISVNKGNVNTFTTSIGHFCEMQGLKYAYINKLQTIMISESNKNSAREIKKVAVQYAVNLDCKIQVDIFDKF